MDSNHRTRMRTDFLPLQFSLPFLKCLQSGLSLHHFQMPGIKSLHSKFLSSSGLSSALLPVKTSPTQPSFHHTISCMSCNFCFYKQSIQSAAFSHSATCPNAERLLIIHFDFCFVNTFFNFFIFYFSSSKSCIFTTSFILAGYDS